MTFQTEFTDFPEADMPSMPSGFEDRSWHNESCPSFMSDALRLAIFVDYKDVSLREYPEFNEPRFTVYPVDAEGCLMPADPIITTDDWNAVLHKIADIESEMQRQAPPLPSVQAVSMEFIRILREWLTADEWSEMCHENKLEPASSHICHSHDHCDANMAMHEAMCNLGLDGEMRGDWVTEKPAMTDLWNAAWEASMPTLRGEVAP